MPRRKFWINLNGRQEERQTPPARTNLIQREAEASPDEAHKEFLHRLDETLKRLETAEA